MSRSQAVYFIVRILSGTALPIILLAAFFLLTLSARAQDPGADAAAALAIQQTNQAIQDAQAAQRASQQMMDDAQRANQQAMQAQQAAMDTPAATPRPTGQRRADRPRFYPSPGKYKGATSVTIKVGTPRASIFYTLDGTKPTTFSTPYTGPVLVSSNSKLRAISGSRGYISSRVATAKYVIK